MNMELSRHVFHLVQGNIMCQSYWEPYRFPTCAPQRQLETQRVDFYYSDVDSFTFRLEEKEKARGENKEKQSRRGRASRIWLVAKTQVQKGSPAPDEAGRLTWGEELMQMSPALALPLCYSLFISFSLQICICAAGGSEIPDWGSSLGQGMKGIQEMGFKLLTFLFPGKCYRIYRDQGAQISERFQIVKYILDLFMFVTYFIS